MKSKKEKITKEFSIYENKEEKEIFEKIEDEMILEILNIESERVTFNKAEIREVISVDTEKKEIVIEGKLSVFIRTTEEYKGKIENQLNQIEKKYLKK